MSGGTTHRCNILIKACPKTQAALTKAIAESVLYSVVKGADEGPGVCTLLRDFGEGDPLVRMHADATAAKGLIERKGLSKVCHIDTDVLLSGTTSTTGTAFDRSRHREHCRFDKE